jgi:hypothetical protein
VLSSWLTLVYTCDVDVLELDIVLGIGILELG